MSELHQRRGASQTSHVAFNMETPSEKSKEYNPNPGFFSKLFGKKKTSTQYISLDHEITGAKRSSGWLSSLVLIILTVLFVLPLFLCAPEPLFESHPPVLPSFRNILQSAIPSKLMKQLPHPVTSWIHEVPALSETEGERKISKCPPSTTFFNKPACTPICVTLYYGRRSITSLVHEAYTLVLSGLDSLVVRFRLAPSVSDLLAIPRIPPWFLYRIGQPLIAAIQDFTNRLIPADRKLLMYSTGFMHSAVLRAVAKLHIADVIHHYNDITRVHKVFQLEEDEKKEWIGKEHDYQLSASELGVDLDTIAKATCSSKDHLFRLLRAAQVIGVFTETQDGRWRQSVMSDYLREDHPHTFKAGALMMGSEQYVALSSLHLSVLSGSPAFSEIYGDFWEYHNDAHKEWDKFGSSLRDKDGKVNVVGKCTPFIPKGAAAALVATKQLQEQDKERGITTTDKVYPYNLPSEPNTPTLNNVRVPIMYAINEFNQGMTAVASSSAHLVSKDGNFAGFDTVIDIAGGRGHLLREILENNPFVSTGVVFDQQSVYDEASTRELVKTSMTEVIQQRRNHGCKDASVPLSSTKDAKRDSEISKPKQHIEMVFGSVDAVSHTISSGLVCDETAKVCPRVYVQSGSFFEAASIPRAHDYALPALQHKLQKVSSRLASGRVNGVEAVTIPDDHSEGSVTRAGVHALKVRHNAAYVMMQILHDWSDKNSIEILKNIRTAMIAKPSYNDVDLCCKQDEQCEYLPVAVCTDANADKPVMKQIKCPTTVVDYKSKLYIIDRVLESNGNMISTQGSNFADILMMNNFDNAKERYVEDMNRVLTAGGFKLLRVIPTRSYYSIVEAEPLE